MGSGNDGASSPGSSTTAAAGPAPTFADGSVTVNIDPDPGVVQAPNSIEVPTTATLTLIWEATNADSVNIDPGDTGLPASGSKSIPAEDATYTLTAVSNSGGQSTPYIVSVHTHDPSEQVSPHAMVNSGITTSTTSAPANTTSAAPSAQTTGAASTTAAPAASTTAAAPGTTTTAAPSASTTAAPSASTTAAPSASTTAAPSASTTAAPSASTTAAASASTTAAPSASTTAAPSASTTAAASASTTAAPSASTTAAPSASTTAAPSASTTAAPSASTTAAASASTTAAPGASTTAPNATTTAAPSNTTTKKGKKPDGKPGTKTTSGASASGPAKKTTDAPPAKAAPTPGSGKRIRLSLWSFNASFIDTKNSSPTKIGIDANQVKALQDSRIDDFSLVRTITFKPGAPDQVAWGNFAPLGNTGLRDAYLQALVGQLHAVNVQVMAGYEIVESGSASGGLGKAFNSWLGSASSADIDKHAQAIADFCAKYSLDGINFDFEINGLGLQPNHAANLKQLYVSCAQKVGAGKMVSYDAAPDTKDGGNFNSFMKVQPLSLAGAAPNLIARPMCFDAVNATSEATVKASIACALRATSDNGGSGLKPSQIQYGLWTSKLGSAMTRWCSDIFKANQVGIVLYNLDNQPGMLGLAKGWEAALNPGAPGPGTKGSPMQVPNV